MKRVNPSYVGVDVGATKIAAGLVESDGTLLHRRYVPTPHAAAASVLDTVASLVAELVEIRQVGGVGVGVPGVVDTRTGTVVSATRTMVDWAGAAVRTRLETALNLPVSVDNDVRVMAYGEVRCGAAKYFDDVLFVSVGTGIGGALTRAGRLWHGPHATAGSFAHLVVPCRGAITCGCGQLDHLEAIASGPAIVSSYREIGGKAVDLPEVVERMRAGEEDARTVLTRAARVLGRALAGLLNAVDADAVVVGGGVAQIGDEFMQPLTEALQADVLPPLSGVPVVTTQLGTDAPLIGAALLALDLQRIST